MTVWCQTAWNVKMVASINAKHVTPVIAGFIQVVLMLVLNARVMIYVKNRLQIIHPYKKVSYI